jgi:hypothetical protein
MYAGLYRNQQKNDRIWHKIAKLERIAMIWIITDFRLQDSDGAETIR